MISLFARSKKISWLGGIVLGAFSLISCGNNNASLVITQCLDQDKTPLAQEVVITIDEVSRIWKPGAVCEFQVAFAGESKREITLEAEAGPDFFYYSPRQYDLLPKESKKIQLRFFRAYTIDITVTGADERPLAGVVLSVEGTPIGLTDKFGAYSWRISRPDGNPGIGMKAGYQVKIALDKDGESALAQPIILTQGDFEYSAQGKLNITEKIETGRMASASGAFPKCPEERLLLSRARRSSQTGTSHRQIRILPKKRKAPPVPKKAAAPRNVPRKHSPLRAS